MASKKLHEFQFDKVESHEGQLVARFTWLGYWAVLAKESLLIRIASIEAGKSIDVPTGYGSDTDAIEEQKALKALETEENRR